MLSKKDAYIKKTGASLLTKFVEKKRMQLLMNSFNKCHRYATKAIINDNKKQITSMKESSSKGDKADKDKMK